MRRDERAYRTRPGPSDGSVFWGVCVVIAIFCLVKLVYAERATKSVVPAPPLPQLSQPSATSTVRDPNPFKDDPTWHTGPRPTIEAQPPQASVETRTVDKCVVNGAVTDSGPNDCRGGVASSLPIEQGPDAATIAKAQVEAKQEAARVARQVAAIQQRAAAEQANQVVYSAQAQQQANFRQGECVQLDQLIKSLDLLARQPVPDETVEFFAAMPNIAHPLQLLKDVGLGYLTLGQASPTLSGGEAQRIKLVSELVKVRDDITRRGQKPPHTLYVLDEPTVGLHMADVEKLTRVLHRLGDGGQSVVVIERDFDVIADADWVIDLGPECGDAGGRIVGEGAPYRLVQQHAATFIEQAEAVAGADLPQFVKTEFDGFLACGIRAHCFLRLGCGDCGHDKLVAFSCKRRGFCPS